MATAKPKLLIQIDDLVREMTAEEVAEYEARAVSSAVNQEEIEI